MSHTLNKAVDTDAHVYYTENLEVVKQKSRQSPAPKSADKQRSRGEKYLVNSKSRTGCHYARRRGILNSMKINKIMDW